MNGASSLGLRLEVGAAEVVENLLLRRSVGRVEEIGL